MTFVRRHLDFKFQLGQGDFGEGGFDTFEVKGLRASANIETAGGASMATAELRIAGMSLDVMNRLSILGKPKTTGRRNVVTVSAGDENTGSSVIFVGTILEAWVNANAAPNVQMVITAGAGYIYALKPVPPTSYNGTVDAATIVRGIAAQMVPEGTGGGREPPKATTVTEGGRTAQQVLEDFKRELRLRGIVVISDYRDASKQYQLYRQGLTPADGYNRRSRHQDYEAVDPTPASFDAGKATDAARAAGLRNFRIITESGGRKHLQWRGAGEPGELSAVSGASEGNATGMAFENWGVSVQLENPYLHGTLTQQLQSVARAGNFNYIIENNTVIIWPAGGARGGLIPLVSPETGMVGYPDYTQAGIRLTTLFNPNLKFGIQMQVESELTPASGRWSPYLVRHELESETPNGKWFTVVECNVFGTEVPIA